MPRYVKVSNVGTIDEDVFSSAEMDAPWLEVPFDEQYMLGRELYQLRWDDGRVKLKERVELSIGGFEFPADGVTEVAIGVRGDIDPDQTVRVLVNGETHEVKVHDDLFLTSSQPGQFTVRVEDPYVYASPSERTIVATEPEHAED